MKWVLRILGVVALLVAALFVTASNANTDVQLVVDGVGTFTTPTRADKGGTAKMKEGERYYGEFDVYAVDTVGTGANPIGEGKWYGVSTEPKGIGEWWESQTIHIFGRGVIEGVDTGPPWKGAIIGGTGEFAGASGEYSAGGGGAGFFRLTFTFQD